MNAVSLTRHLFLKDLRYLRIWLALLWSLAFSIPFIAWSATASPGSSGGMTITIVLTGIGFYLSIFLLLAYIICLDAPGRRLHFLFTRPIRWTALLSGKVLFIALFLLLPVWIVKCGIIYMAQIPVNFTDVVLLFTETVINVGAILAVVMLYSLFFRTVPAIAFSMLASGIFATVVLYFSVDLFPVHNSPHVLPTREIVTLGSSKTLVFYICIILTVGVVAMCRYRWKSVLKPIGILILGLVFSGLASRYWNYDLSRIFGDYPQDMGELAPPLRDQVKFALVGEQNQGGNSLSEDEVNGIRHLHFHHDVSLEGVKPPYFATLVGYQADVTLKSGRIIHASYDDYYSMGIISPALLQQIAGFPSNQDWTHTGFDIFTYQPDKYQGEDLTGASLKGVLILEIRRAVVLKTMPFKSGATVNIPRRHYLLQDVAFKPTGVDYKITANSIQSALRGDYPGWRGVLNFSWLVFNRSKGEYLENTGASRSESGSIFCDFSRESGSLRREVVNNDFNSKEPIPEDWADNAEISFFTTESYGQISFPYEIKGIDLKH